MSVVDSMVVDMSKEQIDKDLSLFDVTVVGSRMTEEGYELVLEGDEEELSDLIEFWSFYLV